MQPGKRLTKETQFTGRRMVKERQDMHKVDLQDWHVDLPVMLIVSLLFTSLCELTWSHHEQGDI